MKIPMTKWQQEALRATATRQQERLRQYEQAVREAQRRDKEQVERLLSEALGHTVQTEVIRGVFVYDGVPFTPVGDSLHRDTHLTIPLTCPVHGARADEVCTIGSYTFQIIDTENPLGNLGTGLESYQHIRCFLCEEGE